MLIRSVGPNSRQSKAASRGVVYLYAGRDGQVEVELPLPKGSKTARLHGLLTFTMCEIAIAHGAHTADLREN